VADRKPFLLRLPPDLLEQLRRWAEDEMRSLNGQIEYVLRQALKKRGRLPEESGQGDEDGER
jgi:hypothetical protein